MGSAADRHLAVCETRCRLQGVQFRQRRTCNGDSDRQQNR